jgi:hypothetical protein
MAVCVNLPIRIKVDPCSLLERQCCIEDGLSDAVTRALKNSTEVVLGERGDSVEVNIHPPELLWSGDGLTNVPNTLRATIERRICRALAKAMQASGIPGFAAATRKSAQPPPDDVAEQIDRARYGPLLGRYLIPSYGGPEESVAVQVESERETSEEEVFVLTFTRVEQNWEERDYLYELLFKALEYDPDHPYIPETTHGIVGLLFSHYSGGYFIALYQLDDPHNVVVENDARGRTANVKYRDDLSFRITARSSWAPTLKNNQIQLPMTSGNTLAANGFYMRWLAATSVAERQTIQEKWIRKNFPIFLSDRLQQERLRLGLSETAFAALIDQTIKDRVANIEDDPSTKSIVIFETGTYEPHFVELDFEVPHLLAGNRIAILPRTDYVPRSKIGEGAGGRAGGAKSGSEAGTEAQPSRVVDAPDVKCEEEYTDHSALNPEGYLDDTDFDLHCRALLGEPSLDQLGADGRAFQARVDALAGQLSHQSCRFAGNFCLGAGQVIAKRARELGEYAVTDEAGKAGVIKPSNQGNLGFIQFEPQATKVIQDLQALTKLMDQVLELSDDVYGLYKGYWDRICGRWYQYVSGWGLAFDVLFKPIKDEAIGNLFMATCRVLLLQLLEASRSQIKARKTNIKIYAPVFDFLFRSYFTKKSELENLKARLQSRMVLPGLLGTAPSGSWLALSTSLVEEFRKGQDVAKDALRIQDDFVYHGNELVGIRDEYDNIWTKDALEQALTQREFLVESIDPLIKQFSSSEAELIITLLNQKTFSSALFTARGGDLEAALIRRLVDEKEITAERVVESILDVLLDRNDEQTRKVRSDFRYAFETAPLHEDSSKSHIPYCGFDLQGIHKLADEQIGDRFALHPNVYGWILNDLLAGEAGKGELLFAGLTLLAVLCPPLGAVAGAVVAVRAYGKALEKKALFRSLIDPDLIMTRAEVEAELFAAELGLALAFIPEIKPILGGAAKGIQVIAREGVPGSARAVVQQVRRGLTGEGLKAAASALRERFAAQVAEQLKDGLVEAMIKQLAVNEVMDLFLSKLLVEPVLDRIQEEFRDYAQGARGPGLVTAFFGNEPGPPEGSQGAR